VWKHLVLGFGESQPAIPRFKSIGSTSSGGLGRSIRELKQQFLFFITNENLYLEKNDA